jgi:hypothetical protein
MVEVGYLLGVDNVHDDSALEHTGQAGLDGEGGIAILNGSVDGEFGGHFSLIGGGELRK